jgi:4-hydroxy-3-methylbut-2-enyl diphosphate reductase
MPTVPRRRRSPEEVLAAAPVPGPKKVLLAAPRGYCAGVDRAVIAVEKALQHYGPPVYVRKQIVHNVHVVSSLEEQGAIFVDETDEVPEGALVIFSAHGVSPAVVQSAEDRGLRTIDATCPLVTKVHKEAVRFAKDDFDILLIGHDGHEEVEGTAGEAPDHIQIINGPHEVDKVTVRDPEKVIWLSQTTLSVDETMETVRLLKDRFPHSPGSAQRRHLLRHDQPPGGHQEDRAPGGSGDRGRFGKLLQLRPPRRSGTRIRRQGVVPC